ncbi:hypothetical protein [Amycolatopsis sp. NPDC021455]|uniref:hypothetical protein n=1 Tax=Amycolatopsis sp. NPDC021455 TaxID=3154901 RepID=UPI0033E15B43
MSLSQPEPGSAGSRRRMNKCGHCGRPVPVRTVQLALVPNSSAADLDDIAGRGQRLVAACSDEHMAAIVAEAQRAWRDDEWWFSLLREASTRPAARRATLVQVAERAGLSATQLEAALAWNATRPRPRTALPGGQPIPPRPSCAPEAGLHPPHAADLCASSGPERRSEGA